MNRKGFTLIELLVVIVIIGILMAILLPALAKALCNARAGKASALVRQIETAAEQYEKEQNVYPTDVPPTYTSTTIHSLLTTNTGARSMPYVQAIPGNPGYFVNPVVGAGAPSNDVKYRRNGPGVGYNTNRFDIWCTNCDPPSPNDKINNWKG